jgi:hypothetical protein
VPSVPAANVTPASDDASELVTSTHGSSATGEGVCWEALAVAGALAVGDEDAVGLPPHATSNSAPANPASFNVSRNIPSPLTLNNVVTARCVNGF